MAVDAIVILETLRCITLKIVEQRQEPYIWPALIRIDDNTLSTENGVAITGPFLSDARVVIKDSMQEGDIASIPASVGTLRTRFEDDLVTRFLILVVALFDFDESPERVVKAGFEAFFSELPPAIAERLIDLSQADEEQTKQISTAISERVAGKVKSTIEDKLSAFEKAQVFAGILNLDDPIGSDFKSFDNDSLFSHALTLNFEFSKKIFETESFSKFAIQGRLKMRPVAVERCQKEVDAVIAAQGVVNGLNEEIKELQDQLKGSGDEDGDSLPKDFILKEINRIRNEELPPAEADLAAARAALQFCRDRQGLGGVLGGGVLTTG